MAAPQWSSDHDLHLQGLPDHLDPDTHSFTVRANEIANSFIPGLPVTPTPTVLGECGMVVIAPALDDDLHGGGSFQYVSMNLTGA